MSTDAEIREANARQLLENPALVEAFYNVREGLVAQIEATPVEDIETRNQLGISLQCLACVKLDIEWQIAPGIEKQN